MGERSRRTRRVGALLLAAIGVSLLMTPTGIAGAKDGVVKGGANASADSISFELTSSGYGIGFTFGRSTASYRDVTAKAQGQSLDLGILMTLFGMDQCGGKYPPLLNLSTLPANTITDSLSPDAAKSRATEVFWPAFGTDPIGAKLGEQDATATPQPWSRGTTTIQDSTFWLIDLKNPTTEATTEFKDGTRIARGVSRASELTILGGLISIQNPKWEAVATGGVSESTTATFTFDSASVFGVPRSQAAVQQDLANFKTTIQDLLSGLGVEFQLPEVRPFAEGRGVQISPMGFVIKNPPIGRDLIVPFLNSEAIAVSRERSLQEDCRNETVWVVLDVLKGAMSGAGTINLLAGGAAASTDPTDYSYKPEPEAAAPAAVPDTTVADTTVVDDTTGDFATDDFATDDFTTEDFTTEDFGSDLGSDFGDDTGFDDTVAGETELAETSDLSAGGAAEETTDTEEIAAPASSDGDANSNATAVAVGALALLGALGLSAGDQLLGRRNRRRIDS